MKKQNQLFAIKYNAVIQSLDGITGKILKETKIHNLIVDTGLNAVADLLSDLGGTGFSRLVIGEGSVAPASTDTALGNESKRQLVIATNEGTGIRKYDHTFTVGTGETFTITEAGLSDSAVESGSTLLNRLTFSGHTLDVSMPLRVIITITLATP